MERPSRPWLTAGIQAWYKCTIRSVTLSFTLLICSAVLMYLFRGCAINNRGVNVKNYRLLIRHVLAEVTAFSKTPIMKWSVAFRHFWIRPFLKSRLLTALYLRKKARWTYLLTRFTPFNQSLGDYKGKTEAVKRDDTRHVKVKQGGPLLVCRRSNRCEGTKLGLIA